MNTATLKSEIGQCLSWAEYANDYTSFELFNKDVAPLDSAFFSVPQVEALYHYACLNCHTEKSLCVYDYPQDDLAMIWMGEDSILGLGVSIIDAAQDFMDTLTLRYDVHHGRKL
jgi:hypothetical protein